MRDSLRPPSIFPLVNLPLPFPCRTGILRSTNFASFGAHSSPFILCVVFSRRTIHGVLGSHASALTATIHRFILFLRQRLFVTPLRDTRRREGGNVGEETVKNKRKPSLRWKNEKKKERERERGSSRGIMERGETGIFLRYSIQSAAYCDSNHSQRRW